PGSQILIYRIMNILGCRDSLLPLRPYDCRLLDHREFHFFVFLNPVKLGDEGLLRAPAGGGAEGGSFFGIQAAVPVEVDDAHGTDTPAIPVLSRSGEQFGCWP